jgi:hypothetical protein
MCEWLWGNVNGYGEQVRGEVPQGRRIFPASGVSGALRVMSKTTSKIIKKHAMLAGHRMGSDPTFLPWRRRQKLGIKVQILHANLVAMCMPYGDAYHMRSAPRNAGAFVQHAVVVREVQMGSHPRPVAGMCRR